MRATVAGDSPPSTRATARRRRRSSSAAVPIGRVMFHYTDVQSGIQALAVLISVGPDGGRPRRHRTGGRREPPRRHRRGELLPHGGPGDPLPPPRPPAPPLL